MASAWCCLGRFRNTGFLQQLQRAAAGANKDVFRIDGLRLAALHPAVTAQHLEKVYGQASVGAPPMSVPHLDARYLDGYRFFAAASARRRRRQ
jgi:malate dehydrogenase (quinone)